MSNPFSLLKKTRRRRILETGGIALASVVVVAGAVFAVNSIDREPSPVSTPSTEVVESPAPSPSETPTPDPEVTPVQETVVEAPPIILQRAVCPAGTVMVEGDESGPTGCLPEFCMGALPDPVPVECTIIIRP